MLESNHSDILKMTKMEHAKRIGNLVCAGFVFVLMAVLIPKDCALKQENNVYDTTFILVH